MRLLVVEDNLLIGDGLKIGLSQEGYAVNWVKTAEDAEHTLQAEQYDGLILDLALPKKDGLSLLKQLRLADNTLPVLVLTARDTVHDRVQGLDAGADDYLVKPFSFTELLARLRALLRRANGRATPKLWHGDLCLDPAAHHVTLTDEPVSLSPKEFAILKILLENKGKVLSRARLEDSLYGWNEFVESNAVEVYIHHLRKKLGKDLIQNVRGVGYMINATP
ncbi:response regulator with CheY-like receiver domain and winged-helix DNA-binding domain [Beggiatoa alba B18LD]|uniref:Response regulator with CheY-like receiver domain and winged-helix DNA-binding domain n=1 Tax=Beggiatoa alba B18LD TaxID=395493 RepID=I3CCU6_9GAMM|nr:response regulator [Beggiatoa alba]EIJ41439.1 response regulator with CheY-like receiver domain and winged-helix DNA-binding domain [Beggiatoa alba B18LD]